MTILNIFSSTLPTYPAFVYLLWSDIYYKIWSIFKMPSYLYVVELYKVLLWVIFLNRYIICTFLPRGTYIFGLGKRSDGAQCLLRQCTQWSLPVSLEDSLEYRDLTWAWCMKRKHLTFCTISIAPQVADSIFEGPCLVGSGVTPAH